MSNITIIMYAFIAYLIAVLIIGALSSRYANSQEGFYLGGRKMGSWVTAISSTASSESGWLVMGLVGEAYLQGMAVLWVPVGCLLGYTFNWFVLAPRLRKEAKQLGALTVPDILAMKTKDNTGMIRIISVLIIVFLMFTYVAAQFNAAGKLFNSIFEWKYQYGVLVGGLVTIVYTMMGGFKAVAWTDLLQGLLMVSALVLLPIMAIIHLGGFSNLISKINDRPYFSYNTVEIYLNHETKITSVLDEPIYFTGNDFCNKSELTKIPEEKDYLILTRRKNANKKYDIIITYHKEQKNGNYNFTRANNKQFDKIVLKKDKEDVELLYKNKKLSIRLGKFYESFEKPLTTSGGKTGWALFGFIFGMLGIGLGYPGSPHVVTRYMAAENKQVIERGRVIAMCWGILAFYGAVITGLSARVILPNITDPEYGLLELTQYLFHPLIAGLILASVLAAIKSTADSQLLVVSSSVVRDFMEKVLNKTFKDKTMVIINRTVVLLIGLAGLFLALTKNKQIFKFVLFSWAGLGASFGPALILSVFWKKTTKWGIACGMIAGILTAVFYEEYLKTKISALIPGLEIYRLVPAFIVGFCCIIIVSLLTTNKRKSHPEGVRS